MYSMHDFPVAFNRSDIKAGKCIVHSIDMVRLPAAAVAVFQESLVLFEKSGEVAAASLPAAAVVVLVQFGSKSADSCIC